MRQYFPEDEAKYKWLSMLLDAYEIIDNFAQKEIPKVEAKRKKELACKRGCSECCKAPIIDINEIELCGISWYTSEKLIGNVRKTVKSQLLNHRNSTRCPFLVDCVCSIYTARPITCRQFHVTGEPCGEKEDVLMTRPQDIWAANRAIGRKVALKILPFWGIHNRKKQEIAFENGFMAAVSKPMHRLDMKAFYDVMEVFDNT